MDVDGWIVYMRRALKSIGYTNPERICFHSFRHSWCTTTLSEIGDQRICMIGSGHETDKVFAHYANHIKKESALETIAKTQKNYLHQFLKNCLSLILNILFVMKVEKKQKKGMKKS